MLPGGSDLGLLPLVSQVLVVLIGYSFHLFAEWADGPCKGCHESEGICILFNSNHIMVLSVLGPADACFTQMPLM